MRKVIFGGANSLDNYFGRKDGAVDWLLWNDEVGALLAENWKRFDTMLMGRKTYEAAQGMGGSSKIKTYVFSRTLPPGKRKGVEIVGEDAAGFVRKLKEQDGKDICLMGGGDFAKTLFEAGLIDEIGFNVHPVLLGAGIPIFHEMSRQIDLELLECKPLRNGCVILTYRVNTMQKRAR
jgi:dihydrofolate reductase